MGLIIEDADAPDMPLEAIAEKVDSAWRQRWGITPAERAMMRRRVVAMVGRPDDDGALAAIKLALVMTAQDQDDQHHIEGARVAIVHEHRTPAEVIAHIRQRIEELTRGKVGAAGRHVMIEAE